MPTRYFRLAPAIQLRAGFKDEGQTQPFYFDCAMCDAKEPPIAGVLASDAADGERLAFEHIAILTDGPRGPRHALFCEACMTRLEAGASLSLPAASAAGEEQQQHSKNTEHRRMKATIKGNILTVEIEMTKPTASATGKTLVVASSHGNQATTATVDGKPVVIGLNAYIKP